MGEAKGTMKGSQFPQRITCRMCTRRRCGVSHDVPLKVTMAAFAWDEVQTLGGDNKPPNIQMVTIDYLMEKAHSEEDKGALQDKREAFWMKLSTKRSSCVGKRPHSLLDNVTEARKDRKERRLHNQTE